VASQRVAYLWPTSGVFSGVNALLKATGLMPSFSEVISNYTDLIEMLSISAFLGIIWTSCGTTCATKMAYSAKTGKDKRTTNTNGYSIKPF